MPNKFMLSIRDDKLEVLRKLARERDVGLQELIRTIIIPWWLKQQGMV